MDGGAFNHMERGILFRDRRTDNGEWIDGALICLDDGETRIATSCLTGDDPNLLLMCAYEADPNTIGEFTGLLDKDNNKIFEGDILLFGDKRVVVYWDGERFSWMAKKVFEYPYRKFPDYDDWDYIDLGWIASEIPCLGKMTTQIVGNIYDNPELLEV